MGENCSTVIKQRVREERGIAGVVGEMKGGGKREKEERELEKRVRGRTEERPREGSLGRRKRDRKREEEEKERQREGSLGRRRRDREREA